MLLISRFLKKLANSSIWQDKIKEKFGIQCQTKEPGSVLDPIILRQTYQILSLMPTELVRACGVTNLSFSGLMGPSLPRFPNHGYFNPGDNSITLNNNIFLHPDVQEDFFDEHGYYLSRPTQTLVHEMGHALDDAFGDISQKSEWMSLSGWSFEPKLGLKRLVINEPGKPPIIGEMYYNPKIGGGAKNFTRFYAMRNSWDDMADSFSFYVAGLRDKVPANKRAYLENLLKKYY
jgi:hypothetical protein